MSLPTDHFPRIVALSNGTARINRCNTGEIGYDLGTGNTLDAFVVTDPAKGAAITFDEDSSEGYPSDAELAGAIDNPPVPVVAVPAEVPLWAMKAIVQLAGLTATINAFIASLPEPTQTVAYSAWNDGNVITRSSTTVAALIAYGIVDSATADAMFIQASQLNA